MRHRSAFPLYFALLFTSLTPLSAQSQRPQDKPVSATAEQVKKFEDAIAPYVKKARETLPAAKKKYMSGLPKDDMFFITTKLYESKRYEQVFVRVTSWKGDTIEGILASDLNIIHNHSKGEKITCQESDVLDWTISKSDGTEEGNFVGRFLDNYQP